MEAFLEDYDDLMDPVGIDEKIQYNRHVEDDFLRTETSYMGHLLVNDVNKFRSLVRAGPEKLVKELFKVADGGRYDYQSVTMSEYLRGSVCCRCCGGIRLAAYDG